MKYKLSIISKNYWSSDFLKIQINEIFNNLFHITCHSPDTTPIIPIYDADMILLHEPSVLIEMQDYIKCDCPVLLMRRTITSKALQKLKEIPAGSTAIVVNLNDYMAKETLTNIYQLGIKNISMSTWNPSQGEIPKTDYIITPRVYDFLPTSSVPTIVLGSRILTADIIMDVLSYFNIDIDIADSIIKNHMIKAPSFFHGVNYLLENNRFMSIQWDILFNKINKGIAVVNKDNSISSMNKLFSQYIDSNEKLSLEDLSSLHKDLSIVLQSDKLTNELVYINNKKFVLNTNNMKNKSHYLGKIITIEPYNQIQSIQQSVHKKIVGNENVAKYHFDDIISKDKSMQKCITIGKRIANSSSPILIYGESGTGKELMASSIHNFSDRSSKPYVAVNCAGIPNELLESEFFGYQDGAFTGAKRGGSIGLFEKANGGTIFLDEISEIPYTLQARLLRVLQEKEIRKVGSNYNISIDVRIIAASNKNLYEMVEENLFRRDLYYRLNTFQLTLPPLKKRTEDIPILCDYYLNQISPGRKITKEFYAFASKYPWPGNIRELKNIIEFMSIISDSDIQVKNLPDYIKNLKLLDTMNYNKDMPFKEILMLKSIYSCINDKLNTGRRSLAEYFSENYYSISEMETRKLLHTLEEKEFIIIQKGRSGCALTEKGLSLIS